MVALRLMIVVAAAALVGTSGADAGRKPPGRPPLKVGAHLYLCPSGFSVAGYRSSRVGKIAFAALHPAHPSATVRIARCFASLGGAKRAGYRPAALPAGDALVRGIFLIPTGSEMRTACQTSANAAGFPILCPGLLPTHPYWECPCVSDNGYLLMAWGEAPSSYTGDQQGSVHLVFGASRDPTSPWVSCTGAIDLGPATMADITGRLLSCPPASESNGGHLLFVWQSAGITYIVSAHGHTQTNRELIAALIGHLTLVSPSS